MASKQSKKFDICRVIGRVRRTTRYVTHQDNSTNDNEIEQIPIMFPEYWSEISAPPMRMRKVLIPQKFLHIDDMPIITYHANFVGVLDIISFDVWVIVLEYLTVRSHRLKVQSIFNLKI